MEKQTRRVQPTKQAQKPSQQVSVGRIPSNRTPVRVDRTRPAQTSAQKQPQSPSLVRRLRRVRKEELAHRHAVREPKFITVRKHKQNRAPFPFGLVTILVLITAMFLFMMMNYAELDRYNGDIRDLRREVANLQAEQKKLDVKLENKDDRSAFDTYATEHLGMVKADALNKYIVTLNPEDKTEIMEYEDTEESGFGYLLSGLAEVVRDFFG